MLHKQDEVQKYFPVTENIPPVSFPARARLLPRFRLFHFSSDEERQQRRQAANKKHGTPSPFWKDGVIGDGSENKAE
jgi:hypothetical protein